jgi:hypothetical protein
MQRARWKVTAKGKARHWRTMVERLEYACTPAGEGYPARMLHVDVETMPPAPVLRVGQRVKALRHLDPEGANVKKGAIGVVAQAIEWDEDTHLPFYGPRVEWEPGPERPRGGTCNIYKGDVEVIT